MLHDIDGLAVETQPQKVSRRSRDFYWYSPVLQARSSTMSRPTPIVTPRERGRGRARRCAACHRHRVPLTVRGGGTGNYGQAMPLRGGIVLDLSELTAIKAIGPGRVRAEAGIKLADLDAEPPRTAGRSCGCTQHAQDRHHRRLRRRRQLGGIGSITWGLLRDRGNILMARVVTMEAEPRIARAARRDVQKVNHAYGTNGIITELELPLAPAYRWAELLVGFADSDGRPLRRRARARGRDPEEAGLP